MNKNRIKCLLSSLILIFSFSVVGMQKVEAYVLNNGWVKSPKKMTYCIGSTATQFASDISYGATAWNFHTNINFKQTSVSTGVDNVYVIYSPYRNGFLCRSA